MTRNCRLIWMYLTSESVMSALRSRLWWLLFPVRNEVFVLPLDTKNPGTLFIAQIGWDREFASLQLAFWLNDVTGGQPPMLATTSLTPQIVAARSGLGGGNFGRQGRLVGRQRRLTNFA